MQRIRECIARAYFAREQCTERWTSFLSEDGAPQPDVANEFVSFAVGLGLGESSAAGLPS